MIKIAICDDSIEFNEILSYKIKNALSKLIDIEYTVTSLRIWTHLRNIMTTTELT